MKYISYILIVSILLSCSKKTSDSVTENANPKCFVFELQQKPSIVLYATVSNGQVTLSWNKKRRQSYTLYRDGVAIHSCTYDGPQSDCGTFVDNPPHGTYTYRVNNSNTVSVNTWTSQSVNRIRLDFDGGYIPLTSSWWNLQGQTIPGSGLQQWQIDSVYSNIVKAFSGFNVEFVPDGEADQILFPTTYWEWFGSAGGVAFIGSWKTGEPCFVFTERLNYRWFDIAFASVHELGHTLGFYHAVEDCSQSYGTGSNWMKGNYQWALSDRQWETLLQQGQICDTVNQVSFIRNILQ